MTHCFMNTKCIVQLACLNIFEIRSSPTTLHVQSARCFENDFSYQNHFYFLLVYLGMKIFKIPLKKLKRNDYVYQEHNHDRSPCDSQGGEETKSFFFFIGSKKRNAVQDPKTPEQIIV